MKVKLYNKNDNLYTPGRIVELYEKLSDNVKLTYKDKLQDTDMAQIPKLFSRFPRGTNVLEVENDAEIATMDGKVMTGRDFKALLLVMYKYTRSAYWHSKESMIYNSSLAAATPLPLSGFKTHQKIDYEDWVIPGWKMDDDGNPYLDDLMPVFLLDLYLGYALSSTELTDDGVIQLKGKYGLARARAYTDAIGGFVITARMVRAFRELGMGKRRGNYASAFGASDMTLEEFANHTQHSTEDEDLIKTWRVYNKSCTLIKLMLGQRWCWYNLQRSPEMVGQITNWDKHYASIDKDSALGAGIAPTTRTNKSTKELFGL